ncbi:MAG: hypothetical protein RM368_06365 [Nostoc sp. DedSLP03]|uniref:hypothetical protein n=1 Tax=Nostoc sp. DedSLP03 TaxID=3075400 RepID=UPI002AD32AD8|nr:hypothetical protein [Nostoc sp. DedSLP03]MDZ7964585.1 hypothetical protein [Nostoc sp. DedSLP03]
MRGWFSRWRMQRSLKLCNASHECRDYINARKLSVSLYGDSQKILLRISDNGYGFHHNNIPSGHL